MYFLEILEFLELIFRRADCDPSDDRPCTTTHLQREGLSILMPICRRISIYVYIYICIDTPTNTITNTNTDIDRLLNAQASTSMFIKPNTNMRNKILVLINIENIYSCAYQ